MNTLARSITNLYVTTYWRNTHNNAEKMYVPVNQLMWIKFSLLIMLNIRKIINVLSRKKSTKILLCYWLKIFGNRFENLITLTISMNSSISQFYLWLFLNASYFSFNEAIRFSIDLLSIINKHSINKCS